MLIETARIRHDAAGVPYKGRAGRQRGRPGTFGRRGVGHRDESGLHPEALVRFPVARATGRVLALAASIAAMVIAGGAAIRPF